MSDVENKITEFQTILRSMFIQTDAISTGIMIPITTAILLFQLEMGTAKNLLFIGVLLAATLGNIAAAYYIFKYTTRGFSEVFKRWAEGSEISDDEYRAAKNALFAFPLKQSILVIIRWCLAMPLFILFVHVLANVTFIQEFNMWALLILNVVLSSILYYRMTERGIEKIAMLGALNRDSKDTGESVKRLSLPLTYTVISYILLTLLFIGGSIFNLNYHLIRGMFIDEMDANASRIDKNVETLFDDKASEVKLLAAGEGIARARGAGQNNAFMKKLVSENDYYEYAFVATAGAAPVMQSCSAPRLTGAPVKEKAVLDGIARAAKGEPSLSGVHRSPLNGKPAVVLCVPLQGGAGVVGLSFDLAVASKRFIGLEKIGKEGYNYITDYGLLALAHPNAKYLMTDFTKYDWGRILQRLPSASTLEYYWEGRHKLLYVKKNKRYGFNTVASIYLSEINNKLTGTALIMLVISLVGLGAVTISMYILINHKLEPLETYSHIIENIANGDLNQRLTVLSDDEVGRMSVKLISFMRRLRHAIRNIKNISDELASSSTEMASTVASFSENAQNQASSAEEVTATVEEMAAGMDSVSNGALIQYESMDLLKKQLSELSGKINEMSVQIQNAFTIADKVAGKALDGEQLMKEMSGSMSKIIDSSKEMTNILGIITGISEQINLLSLNASIEAARAGEAGRGFAVVADEVSKLADQTSLSIKDIDRHIKNNAEETSRGIANSQKTVETISTIIEGVTTMSAMMSSIMDFMRSQTEINAAVNKKAEYTGSLSNDIRIAAEEQKNAVGEIVKSVTNINELTQANASGSEELSGTTENLSSMAESLKQAVDYFKV